MKGVGMGVGVGMDADMLVNVGDVGVSVGM